MRTSRLKPDELAQIKNLSAEGLSYVQIAERTGHSAGTVWRYLKGKANIIDPRTTRARTPERKAAVLSAFAEGRSQLWVIANLHVNQDTIEAICSEAGMTKPYSGRVHPGPYGHLVPCVREMKETGWLNAEIADELKISLITVSRILRKLRAEGWKQAPKAPPVMVKPPAPEPPAPEPPKEYKPILSDEEVEEIRQRAIANNAPKPEPPKPVFVQHAEVIALKNSGLSNKAIGKQLHISETRVSDILKMERWKPAPKPPKPETISPEQLEKWIKKTTPTKPVREPKKPKRPRDVFDIEVEQGLAVPFAPEDADSDEPEFNMRARHKRTSTPAPIPKVVPFKRVRYDWEDEDSLAAARARLENRNAA